MGLMNFSIGCVTPVDIHSTVRPILHHPLEENHIYISDLEGPTGKSRAKSYDLRSDQQSHETPRYVTTTWLFAHSSLASGLQPASSNDTMEGIKEPAVLLILFAFMITLAAASPPGMSLRLDFLKTKNFLDVWSFVH